MFENSQNLAGFCPQAGTPEIIQARLRGEGDKVALATWHSHLASCPQCQKAVEQDWLVRSTFAVYQADPFFEQLSASWQPDLSKLAIPNSKPVRHSLPAKTSFGLRVGRSIKSNKPVSLSDTGRQFAAKRLKLNWTLSLVSGLAVVVVFSFLLLLAVTLSATLPASLPKPSLELVWQVDGHSFGMVKPAGVALDKQGNIYVVEQNYYYVKKLNSKGELITRWGGAGDANGQFISPTGIVVDNQGFVYVTDSGNGRVQKFDSSGNFITKWGRAGSSDGEFNQPWGIAVDNQSGVYVVDSTNTRIQKFDTQGNFLASFGSYGQARGQFVAPRSIVVDRQGQLYVSDAGRSSIQKFTSNGQFLSEWELPINLASSFAPSLELALDAQGYLYVSDQTRALIYKYTTEGKLVASLSSLTVGNLLRRPTGIAVDNQGNIVVADAVTSYLLKFRQP